MTTMRKRAQLNGLTAEQWKQLRHLAQLSGRKRSAYVRDIMVQLIFQRYVIVAVAPLIPTQTKRGGPMGPNLVVRLPAEVMQMIDGARKQMSVSEFVRSVVVLALRYGLVLTATGISAGHHCGECHVWPTSLRNLKTASLPTPAIRTS